jgi:hypothetical protein
MSDIEPTRPATSPPQIARATLAVVASAVLGVVLAACSSGDDSALTVSELLDQSPDGVVTVEGGIYAEGFEYFGEDEIGWYHEVELCDSLTVTEGEPGDEVRCEGASVSIPEDIVSEDLDWDFAEINSQYLEDVVVEGQLVDDAFVVSSFVSSGGAKSNVTTTGQPTTQTTTQTTATAPLPIESLPDEDLLGLRDHVRAVDVVYLAEAGFVDRVEQLRANCESRERLQEILDSLSGRGPEAPQDYVTQHAFVCPDEVAALVVVDGVALPED